MNSVIRRCALIVCAALQWSPCAAAAAEELVFAGSAVDPAARRFRLDPGVAVDAGAVDTVDPERLAATLAELLRVPSASCREGPIAEAARDLLLRAAGSPGAEVRIDDVAALAVALPDDRRAELYCNRGTLAPQSGNVIAYIPGDPARPAWNLSFHLDTNQLVYEGIRREGDLFLPPPGSPLGGDDKAGLAIIAEVLSIVRERGIAHGDIRVVGLVAEEDSAAGAQLVAGEAFRGDVVVSVDGGDPEEIGRAAPTMYKGWVTVRTRTSHPAEIHARKTVSACAVGARFLHEAGFRPKGHPPGHRDVVLHSYFTSCGTDSGRMTPKAEPVADYQYNSISPFWTAAWQMRNLEGAPAARAMVDGIAATLQRVCDEAARDRTPVRCDIAGHKVPELIGYVVAEDAPALRFLDAGYRRTGAAAPQVTAEQFGGFNGNYIKERFGEEMLLLGTGGDQAHTNEETVSVRGMARVARGLLAAMQDSWRYILVP
jgi:di/tripeptidase